jgi:hypothetical protein
MAVHGDIYGHINGEPDMRRVFKEIRQDVAQAGARQVLTELYRRAGYLITLTYAPSWAEKSDPGRGNCARSRRRSSAPLHTPSIGARRRSVRRPITTRAGVTAMAVR